MIVLKILLAIGGCMLAHRLIATGLETMHLDGERGYQPKEMLALGLIIAAITISFILFA